MSHLLNSLKSLRNVFVAGILACFFFIPATTFAADGSGTNVVAPTSALRSSTGNTHAFTFTASETMDSGEITVTVPATWSAPQGSSGTAGFFTATSGAGIIANVVNSLNSTANWSAPQHQDYSVDTTGPQEGTGSLKIVIPASAVAGEKMYINNGVAANWGGINSATSNLRVGLFIKSSVTTTAGQLKWENDDSASLASPLDSINFPALTANTWQYTSIILGALTRNSILSYGVNYATDIGAVQLNFDAMGPMFDPAGANNWVGDTGITVTTQTSGMMEGTSNIRCTYAASAGIGASGDCNQSNATAITQGPGTALGMWVRPSVALNAGDFAWVDDGNTALASPEDTVSFPALPANVWTFVNLTVPNSSNKATQSYGVRQVVDKGAMTFDIDAMIKIVQTGDTTTGWTAPVIQTLSADTTTTHEGGTSLRNTITAAATAGDKWYETFGAAQDWSGYTTVGFWIRSTVATTAGQLQFQYASSADLSAPIATVNIGALTANTWSYQKLTLSGTRTSVKTYGINYAADIGAASIYLDDMLIGPGVPTFPGGGDARIRILALASGQTIVGTYGATGGASGATAPGTSGVSTFTTKSRFSDSGTLANIAAQPTVTVYANPTVTNITSSLANGSYKAAQVVPIQVTFSEAVTVTGTPQITLSTGSPATTAINYTSGSGSTTLTFNYTVAAGNFTGDLDYAATTSLALNSGTIKDTATGIGIAVLTLPAPGAAGSLGGNKAIVIDTTAPVVTTVTPVPTPTNDPTPDFTFNTTEGGTITYGGSCSSATTIATTGSNTITFNTLAPGTYTTCTITVTDLAGNISSVLTIPSFTIDTTAPTVSGVTSSTANGTYGTAAVISIQVNFAESVIVTGTPQLSLSTGSPVATLINYVSGSGSSSLTFTYTVASGNFSPDLDYSSPAALTLNSGTIRDAAGNNATLTLAVPGTAGSLGANKALVIDTIAPTLAVITPVTTPTNDTTPNFTFSTSEGGTITYGGSCASVTTAATTGNNTITFSALPPGTYTNCTITVTDPAGNPSAPLSVPSFTIDTTAPTVSGVTSSTANGTYGTAAVISIQVNFGENVIVTGVPQLTLSTGSPATTAINYVSGSGSSSLTFTYLVAAGNSSPDLDYASTTALALNSGTIRDAAGNNATLTLATPGAANSLGANKAIVIDTTAPVLAVVTPVPTPTNDTTPDFTFSTSEPGTITYGGSCSSLTTVATTGNNTITFNALAPGTYTNCTVTVTDAAGNPSTPLAIPSFTIDTTAPTVSGVTSSTANGTYGVAAVISIQVNFGENVIVTGTPQLTLSTGSPATTAINYVSGSGSSSLTFTYTVAAGNSSPDLDYASTTALALNSGTIRDAAGNNATLTLAAPGAANSLGANKAIVIDTTAPTLAVVTPVTTPTNDTTPNFTFSTSEGGTITYGGSCSSATTAATSGNNTVTFNTLAQGTYTNCTVTVTDAVGNASAPLSVPSFTIDTAAPIVSGVTSSTANGTYTTGAVISIQVNFGENVIVTGTPRLTLSTGSPATTAIDYVSGSGSSSLTFTYTVAAGNSSPDLDYASTTALALNSGTIRDVAGNNATLTLAAPGAANSLGANKAIVIDTTAPTLVVVTPVTAPTNDTTPNFTFSTSEGGTITYGGSCSSATTSATTGNNTVTFNTLAQGTYTNCTITVTDAVGNVSAPLSVPSFTIDTTAPTLAVVTPVPTPDNDTTPSFTFSTTEGGTISYGGSCSSATTAASTGNNTVTFSTLAQGTYTNCTITVTDAAGNPSAPLSVPSFTIDTTAPVLAVVTPVPTPGNDQTPDFTFSSTEPGTITYGGSCSSATTSASTGNNTVTFNTLANGTYTNCTVRVTDAAGNISLILAVPSFTIDAIAPTLAVVTPVPTPDNDTTPNFTFSSTEPGTITYGGDCSAADTSATSGNNTVTFNTLAQGTYTNCTVTVTDAAGNPSAPLSVPSFTIDTTAPVLAVVTPVPTPDNDTTPNFTFSTTEGGTITYGGSCSSATTSASTGNNTVTFNALVAGTYTNCTVTVTDAAGNPSAPLSVPSFTIDTSSPSVTGVTSSTANGTYTTGAVISIQVNFSQAVNVTGTPRLTLSTGSPATTAIDYVSGSGSSSLTFTYTVAAGNFSPDLDYASTTALALNSGTIKDLANNNAILTLAAPGAVNSLGANKAIVIDTVAPTLSVVTPVPTPGNDTTPNFTFNTTEGGTITYGGSCASVTTSAATGNNTVTFNTLASGTYTNCTITVTDAAGNVSAPLSVPSFTIDTTGPALTVVTPVPTPGNDTTPNFTFSSTEPGTITYGGSCASVTTAASTGNNTVTFNTLAQGTYTNCTVTVTDAAGNPSAPLSVPSFTIDTTAPVLAVVTPVPTPGSDTTPNFTFSSTEPGTITYGGSCASATTAASTGNNTVTFNTLPAGTYTNCTITVTDATGNPSAPLSVPSFTIDTTAPVLAVVTPVPTPDDDVTPNFTFSTTEGGTITYGGSCSSVTTAATTGNNTVTFSTLPQGTYTNCTITVTDAAGNPSAPLSVPSFTIDTASPVLAVVTPVPTPGNDPTPDFTFSSTEPGTITYGGSCSSITTAATTGNNTVTFNTLPNGTYTNCTITVTDAAGNPSAPLSVPSFTIDTTAPVLAVVTPVPTPDNDATPNFTFSSTEPGTITYGGDCSAADTSATSGNNTVTFNTLAQGTYTNCTVTVTDAAGNPSAPLSVPSFTIDTSAPVLAVVTPVPTPASDTTPDFTFSTTEAGVITYGGSCSSATTSATSGNNTVTFNTLATGTYTNCTITVTDASGNPSAPLSVPSFTIDATAPVLAVVTPVPTPGSDTTPNFTFSSSEPGTITYGGSCASVTTAASTGNNTVTFNTLAQGTYTNCTITVTDAAGNLSTPLSVPSFTIDTAAPVLAVVTPVPTPDDDQTPNFTFSTTEGGTITYGGSCSSATTAASTGNNTVTFSTLAQGTYTNCTITVTDAAGNPSAPLSVPSFTIDTASPILAVVTPVPTPGNDPTPDFTFSSTEPGTITYGGSCSSITTAATTGNNTVTFNTLATGTYTNCTITVTDAAGNPSAPLSVPSFTIDATAPTVTNVTSTTSNGTYGTGAVISVRVTFSEAVTVTGTPQITLSTGSPVTTAVDYVSGSGSVNLTFTYTVAAGNFTGDLDYASTTALALNSGAIRDAATNDAILTLPAPAAAGSLGANKAIVIDTTAPVLAVVTPVPTPDDDTTPSFTFSSTESGTITYGGSCSSATTSATAGNNTVTFSTLAQGTYTNCTITVTDAVGNPSAPLSVPSFTIDTASPILAVVTPVPTPGNDPTPDFTFSSTEPGTITYGGSCSSVTTAATSGNNTVTFNTLATGTYTNCTITVTDAAGNPSAPLSVPSFTIDATAPVLAVVTPVPTPDDDPTPNFTFSTTEAGTITYGGFCSSLTTSAALGNNTVTFNSLSNGTYTNCTITVTDAAGNPSAPLAVPSFTINVITQTAVKFVILNPTDTGVGTNATITIQAQDNANAIDPTYNQAVTLVVDGAATIVGGNPLVTITNGVGTIQITDTVAQTVNLSLTDTQATGLNVTSTQDIVFAVGALHHFSFNTISSPQTAGTPFGVTITAQDLYSNTVTSFTGTVDLTTTAGAISPAISGVFSAGVRNENVSVTTSGTGRTISATKTGGPENGTSNPFTVVAGPTSQYLLDNPGNMMAGTRLQYTVTRKDALNNVVILGAEAVALYTTSTATGKFYDAPTSGNLITSVTIPDGQSQAIFWYYDDTVGTWDITASDNGGGPDGTLGIDDATDSVFVDNVPIVATQFKIYAITPNTVGDIVVVTVKAVDGSDALDTSYNRTNNTLVLHSTGASTAVGGLFVNIFNGIGTVNITDTTAEMITLSLADNAPDPTPLALNTADVVFNPGPLHHFAFDTIGSPQNAGVNFSVTITAKDQYDNTVPSFVGTADLTTTAGVITPVITGNFGLGVTTMNVSVTGAGTGKTITATKTGSTEAGLSNPFTVLAGPTVAYFLNNPGSMIAGTRLGYTVTRKDDFGNPTTLGAVPVSLYTNSNASAKFFSVSTAGTPITAITIPDGQSQANFWYFDDNVGDWIVTASDNILSPDGVAGIADDTDGVNVSLVAPPPPPGGSGSAPLFVTAAWSPDVACFATHDVHVTVASVSASEVQISEDPSMTTAWQPFESGADKAVTLSAGDGLKTIYLRVRNPGSTSAISQLSTTVDVAGKCVGAPSSPTQPEGTTIGSGTVSIAFSGQAYPSGVLDAFVIAGGNVPIKQSLIKTANGKFTLNVNSDIADVKFYGLITYDKLGRPSHAKIFTTKQAQKILAVNDLLMSPTIDVRRDIISRGDFLTILGYAAPGNTVEFEIDGQLLTNKVAVPVGGAYRLLYNTAKYDFGWHSVRTRQVTARGLKSDFSVTKSFLLTNYIITNTDLNRDGTIDASDSSIFLALWYDKTNPQRLTKLDFNGDLKVDISDLSIFLRTLKNYGQDLSLTP